MNARRSAALAAALLSISACSASNPIPERGSGGASAETGGTAGGSVQAGTGGTPPSSGGAFTGGFGGSGGAAGAPLGGGAGTLGGGAGGGAGTGGASGGSAGFAGTAGGGGNGSGGSSSATPSPGCGNASPATGAQSITVSGNQANYVVTLPDDYAPTTPAPLVFGFHGRNRTHTDFQTVDASGIQTELGGTAIMAYLKSLGGTGWEQQGERELNVDFFEQLLDKMLAEYCVDTSRIFAVGHSSGAHFTHILACRFGDTLRGIGVVAGYLPEMNCNGEVAAMVIHGATDNQVQNSSGRAARDFYVSRNGCQSSTMPGDVSPCVAYQGCDPGLPVQWCEHTEPTYQNTNHGWPSFASRAIGEMFWTLP